MANVKSGKESRAAQESARALLSLIPAFIGRCFPSLVSLTNGAFKERSQGAASEKEESGLSAGEAQKVLSRDDVKEIMEALLTSAREAEKNLADCIADNQMSPKVDVDQTEAIAILIKSCAPLKIVRESTKEKFNVSEAEMIEVRETKCNATGKLCKSSLL